jgi:hypothetical protein
MTLRRGARPRLTRMSLTLLDLTWCMVVSCTDDWKSLRWDSERASVAGAEIERDQIATRRLLSRSDMRGLALTTSWSLNDHCINSFILHPYPSTYPLPRPLPHTTRQAPYNTARPIPRLPSVSLYGICSYSSTTYRTYNKRHPSYPYSSILASWVSWTPSQEYTMLTFLSGIPKVGRSDHSMAVVAG